MEIVGVGWSVVGVFVVVFIGGSSVSVSGSDYMDVCS